MYASDDNNAVVQNAPPQGDVFLSHTPKMERNQKKP